MSDAPLISALVLNYRTPQQAVRCVQALQAQTIAEQIEILVIDNHSQDDSIGVLHNRLHHTKRVRIIETPENLGYGRGNNFAEKYAQGTYIFIINPDNTLEPSGLEQLVRLLESDESIGIVAPALVHGDGTRRDSFRRFPSPWDVVIKRTWLQRPFSDRLRTYLRSGEDVHEPTETDWVVGTGLLLRRSFFVKLGGFDPRFFLFFDDIDLCRRCWEAGKRVVYEPRVRASDRLKRLSEGGVLRMLCNTRGRAHLWSALQYFWKWRGKSAPFR